MELDGSTHLQPKAIKRDRRRDNTSVSGGYAVLRYYTEILTAIRAHRNGVRLNG